MGVGGGSQPSFFGSFSSGGGADGSYAAWLGEYAPAGVWPPAPLEGVESAPKLLGEDEACPAPSKLVGESVWGQEGSDPSMIAPWPFEAVSTRGATGRTGRRV